MPACGYYLVEIGADGEPVFDGSGDPIITGDLVTLPLGRWGREIEIERVNTVHETEKGRHWVFPQIERAKRRMTFRVQPSDLGIFATLDAAVGGQRDPFLFVIDVTDSPFDMLFVRKDAGFVEGAEQPVFVGGQIVRLVDYVLTIVEEPKGPGITA